MFFVKRNKPSAFSSTIIPAGMSLDGLADLRTSRDVGQHEVSWLRRAQSVELPQVKSSQAEWAPSVQGAAVSAAGSAASEPTTVAVQSIAALHTTHADAMATAMPPAMPPAMPSPVSSAMPSAMPPTMPPAVSAVMPPNVLPVPTEPEGFSSITLGTDTEKAPPRMDSIFYPVPPPEPEVIFNWEESTTEPEVIFDWLASEPTEVVEFKWTREGSPAQHEPAAAVEPSLSSVWRKGTDGSQHLTFLWEDRPSTARRLDVTEAEVSTHLPMADASVSSTADSEAATLLDVLAAHAGAIATAQHPAHDWL